MTNLLPFPELQFFDNNGVPLAGGSIGTYVPGTLTPKTTWQDQNQVTANSNPIILDSAGRCIVFGSGQYRFQVFDSLSNLIYDQLSIAGLPDSAISAAMLPVVGAATTATALSLLAVPAYVNTAIANIELLPGPTGPAGPTGATGPTGPTGPAGSSGTVFGTVHDVKSSRTWNVTYTNSNDVPMFVAVAAYSGSANYSPLSMIVNGTSVAQVWSQSAGGALVHTVYGMVPVGATYIITQSTWNSVQSWTETW